MVLDEEQLTELLHYLEERFKVDGCDDTLRLTRDWSAESGVAPDALAASLAHFGGHCDCEVLANVDPEQIF